ncbi:MAG: MFS transporter, partial [Actinomycetota bacterium]|nr:MFS transporter [Actinomycetota bacterium]
RAGRPLMPVFHGAFSLGGMLGAASGGLAAGHLTMPAHFLLAAATGLVVLAIVYPRLPADPPAPADSSPPGRRRRRARPDTAIAVLGAVAFAVALGEGAVGDWSALFLRDDLHTGAGVAAAGFTAFSVTMAAARFAGSAVLSRVGPATALAAGCGLAATGTLVVITAAEPTVALVGFAAIGAGLAYGFPIALAAAGAHHSGSGPAIGAVSTIGYTGFLAGPPLIGFAAQWAGLRVGLGLVGVAAAAGLALALTRRRLLTEADPGWPAGVAR